MTLDEERRRYVFSIEFNHTEPPRLDVVDLVKRFPIGLLPKRGDLVDTELDDKVLAEIGNDIAPSSSVIAEVLGTTPFAVLVCIARLHRDSRLRKTVAVWL